jgi:hypothetical protein
VKTCGTSPLLAGALNVNQPAGPGTPMLLAWAASIDEAAGEGDVTQYNIYRRQLPSLTLELLTTIPAGQPNYVYPDNGVTPGLQYVWAVAAQDCTPAESPMLQTLPTTVP